MDVQLYEEQVVVQSALVPGPPIAFDDRGEDRGDLTLDSVNGSHARVDIRLNAMPCDQRDIVISLLQMARKSHVANILLTHRGNPAGMSAKLAQTTLGGLRGCGLDHPGSVQVCRNLLQCQAQR